MSFENIDLFPINVGVKGDHLILGGCDVLDLVQQYGTPLYVFDEMTLRAICQEFNYEFTSRYPNSRVVYASKAFINPFLARLVSQEGLGLDVVSGGELAVAQAAGILPDTIYFHGNNKSEKELVMALDYGVGRIVVDNLYEIEMLERLTRDRKISQDIWLRISPGIDPHTHAHTTTGILDSKFGIPMETGDAATAVRKVLDTPSLNLVGLHSHLGSPIFEIEPYVIGIDAVLTFAAEFKSEGLTLREFSPGGGFAIGYLRDKLPPPIGAYAEAITATIKDKCATLGIGEPLLVVEPGRAIVGRAGVALYTVGAIKDIPTVRKYVSVDGGMGDNIRPALYDAGYEAVVANRISAEPSETITLAGKFCESGDVLIRDIELPELEPGDVIAVPSSGAYAPSMASNYNLNPRPPVVMVREGSVRLIRRHETYEDMMSLDVLE